MQTTSKLIKLPIGYNNSCNVTITKKRMKNMRLSITKMGEVKLSIPYYTTYDYAKQFLIRKYDWINEQLTKIRKNATNACCDFCDGGSIFLLGQSYPLKVEVASKTQIIFNPFKSSQTSDYGFIVYIKDENVDIKNIFINWCKKYFLDYCTKRSNYIYSQMFKNNNPPDIRIKQMKSMWGNCNFVKKIITFNLYLAKANPKCIDYVIVHELAHLAHHNHGKEFHALINTLLPDWKLRKKNLNAYSLGF
jgi:predicted metal-dependent hydrolase